MCGPHYTLQQLATFWIRCLPDCAAASSSNRSTVLSPEPVQELISSGYDWQCSRNCQTRHWVQHKAMCGTAFQQGEAEALKAMAGRMNARASEPEPESGGPMPGQAASFNDPGPVHLSGDVMQKCCLRRNTKPCDSCHGSGMVEREKPSRVPLERLEGGVTGFIVRERSCLSCDGTGLMVDDTEMLARKGRSDEGAVTVGRRCYRCQAASLDLCTCN
jgi:hypothetical protein